MKKFTKIVASIMTVVLLFISLAPVTIFAEGDNVTATIAFTTKDRPATVILEAEEGCPVPEITKLENVTSGEFKINFTEPGNYFYKVYQEEGHKGLPYYDTTEYTVGIYVMYDEDENLYAKCVLSIDGEAEKPLEIEFINTLPPAVTPSNPSKPPHTGDNSNLTLWYSLMLISGICLFGLLFFKKKDQA